LKVSKTTIDKGNKTTKAQYLTISPSVNQDKLIPNQRYSSTDKIKNEEVEAEIESPNELKTWNNIQKIENYERMLKEVNSEFQISLKRNNELSSQVWQLEFKLTKAEEELGKTQHFIDAQNKARNDKLNLFKVEKTSFDNTTLKLNRSIQEKNDEIRRLRSIQIDLENRLLQKPVVNTHFNKIEQEQQLKLEQLAKKWTILDSQLGDKESELWEIRNLNRTLRNDLAGYEQKESNIEYKIGILMSENKHLKVENDLLRERKLKTGVILKENLSETDNLKRELKLLKNNLEIYQQNEVHLKEENLLLRNKVQQLERGHSQLMNQQEKLNYNQKDWISSLISLENSLINGLFEPTLIRMKLSSIISHLRVNSDTSKFSTKLYSDNTFSERLYTEPTRIRSLTEERTPKISDFK